MKKKKTGWKLLIVVLFIALFATVGYGVMLYMDTQEKIEESQDPGKLVALKDVEFKEGDKIVLTPENFIDASNLTEEEFNQIEMYSDLMTSKKYVYDGSTRTVRNKNKNYLKSGLYSIQFTLDGHTLEMNFSVRKNADVVDTPVDDDVKKEKEEPKENVRFIAPYSTIYVEQGVSADLTKYFLALDDQNKMVDVSYDGNVDFNTEGEYNITISAGSSSVDVIVQVISLDTMANFEYEYTAYIDGSIPLNDHTRELLYAEVINFYYTELPQEIMDAIQNYGLEVSSYRTDNCWNMFD